MKKILLYLAVIFLMIGVCGCMKGDLNQKELAIDHLENKYNEDFEIVSFESRNIDMNYDEVICKNDEGEKITVYMGEEENELVIVDNYYGIIKRAEYKKILSEVFDDFFPEYMHFFSFTASYYDNKFTKDVDIASALLENKEQFFSRNYIFINESSAEHLNESIFKDVCDAIKKRNLSLWVSIYSVSDDEFALMDENQDVDKYLPDDYDIEPLFKETIK